MKKSQLSLANFFLVCLLALFIGLYIYQSNKSRLLEDRITSLTAPLQKEIDQQKWTVQKQELQLQFARASIKPKLDSIDAFFIAENDGQISFKLGQQSTPLGIRRELANIRNAELKLNREKAHLEELESELDGILNPRPNQ